MAGTKEGAAKARETNKQKYGDDFYAKIGAQGWKDPERSRKTGFALLPKDVVVELGRRGGQKNKGKTYAKSEETQYVTPEELHKALDGSDLSE